MKKIKYRFYVDFENEEKWINNMAENGWDLMKFTLGRFTFTKGEPGKYVYRNEFISNMSQSEKKDYFEILKDSGITIIQEFGGWIYMKKEKAEGPFEIYTDTKSKINYYKRILNTFIILFFVNIGIGLYNISLLGKLSHLGFINSILGIVNVFVAALLAFPIIKIMKRKRKLLEDQEFFE